MTINPTHSVADVATDVIENCSRKKASELLSDLYERQVIYMVEAVAAGDNKAIIKHAKNIASLETLSKARDIRREMHVERLKTMPYRADICK